MKREDVSKIIPGITPEQLDSIMNLHGADITAKANEITTLKAEKTTLTEQLNTANGKLEGYDPEWKAKAEQAGAQEDAQAYNDMVQMCERFEKKLYDLELTRTISLQMGPQIRLLQNNNSMMAEKIQSTIVNTIPLWKNQMVLALGLAHSQQAMQAERAVTNMTNDLLKKNAEALKLGTIETAKESQRGIVDIETLQQTNKSLIETLDELNKIQSEGRAKRAAAEQELTRIEDELKTKMMEIRS